MVRIIEEKSNIPERSIKYNIYLYYYNRVDTMLKNIDLPKEDKEDIAQDAKEHITIKLNRLLSEEAPPNLGVTYSFSVAVATILNRYLTKKLNEVYTKKYDVSLDTIDIESNSSIEEKVIYKLLTDKVFEYIDEYALGYKTPRMYERLKKYLGIGTYPHTLMEVASEEGISHEGVSQSLRIIILKLYIKAYEKYKYTQSEFVDQALDKTTMKVAKQYWDMKQEDEKNYPFYNDCDNLNNPHLRIIKR